MLSVRSIISQQTSVITAVVLVLQHIWLLTRLPAILNEVSRRLRGDEQSLSSLNTGFLCLFKQRPK